MKTVHFTEPYLIDPTNSITVKVLGSGATGSKFMTGIAEMDAALKSLGLAGFDVQLFDDDRVTEANLARQRFSKSELGMYKSVARINNINRWFGTNWKAVPYKYTKKNLHRFKDNGTANIFVTCVDTLQARFELAEILNRFELQEFSERNNPFYWLDFGNSKHTGQVILSTVGEIAQPNSKLFISEGNLPFVTEEYREVLEQSEAEDTTPSCSLPEALEKQDLFINSALVSFGCELLWQLCRNKIIDVRGAFMNLADMRVNPIPITKICNKKTITRKAA